MTTRRARAVVLYGVKSDDEEIWESEEEEPTPPPKPESKAPVKRPFKEVGGLPVSDSRPIYSKIKTPLSIRDTAVLYASLRRSRAFWVEGKLFDLFWSKSQERQQKYVISKLEAQNPGMEERRSNIRDRMNKLCDCLLVIGPHSFEIKIFVLKDEKIERQHEELMKKKKELKQQKRVAKEEDMRKRQEVRLNVGPAGFPIANSSPAQPSPPTTNAPKPKTNEKGKPGPKPKTASTEPPKPKEKEKSGSEIMLSPENAIMIKNLNAIARVDLYLDVLMKIVASGKSTPEQIVEFQNYIKKAREMGRRGIEDPKIFFKVLELEKREQALKLETAGMPFTPSLGATRPVGRPRKIRDPEEEALYLERRRRKELKDGLDPFREHKLTAFQERYLHGLDLVFEYSESPTERFRFPKDCIFERVDVNKLLVSCIILHDAESKKAWKEIWEEDVELRKKEKEAEKEAEKNKDSDKEKKESSSIQEGKPQEGDAQKKDASVAGNQSSGETGPTEDTIKNNTENGEIETDESKGGEKQTGETDKEIKKEDAQNDEIPGEKTEEGEKKSEENEEANDRDNKGEANDKKGSKPRKRPKRKTKRFAPRKSKRIAKLEKKLINVLESDESEEEEIEQDSDKRLQYTPVTFLLYDIPIKFMELLQNSFSPQDEVRRKMELMIKHGKKTPQYYLWYSVDGLQDEKLSENLRHELFEVENVKEKKRYSKAPKVLSQMAADAGMTEADLLKNRGHSAPAESP